MVDPVEELRQVDADDPGPIFCEVLLGIGKRRARSSTWTKSVTTWVERWLEDRLQHLVHGLLTPSIHDVWYAEASLAPARLGYPNPPHVAGTITTRQKLLSQSGQ
jgi:hypothetical protein